MKRFSRPVWGVIAVALLAVALVGPVWSAADRVFPSQATNPGGMTGAAYTAAVKEEGDALWDRVVTPVGSVAGTNTITGTSSPPLTADPANGQHFWLAPAGGSTGAVTVNLDSRGAIALVDPDGTALASGALETGKPILFHYDSSISKYRLNYYTPAQFTSKVATAVSGTAIWSVIDDTVPSGSPSTITHAWTPGTYSKIQAHIEGVTFNTTRVFTMRLQTAGGSNIVTCATATNTSFPALQVTMLIDTVSATKRHFCKLEGVVGTAAITDIKGTGANATAPGQIVFDAGASTFNSVGRIVTRGLLVAP